MRGPLSAFCVASSSNSRFSSAEPVDASRKDQSAMLRCALVGGLKDESRTKSVFAWVVAAAGLELIRRNERGEAAKEERVEQRVVRTEAISVSSEYHCHRWGGIRGAMAWHGDLSHEEALGTRPAKLDGLSCSRSAHNGHLQEGLDY